MKLEKREITLNEKDSVTDMLLMQKTLIKAYVYGMERAERKEIRKTLLQMIERAGEDFYLLKDTLENIEG